LDQESRLTELHNYMKCNSIHIIGIPEKEQRENGVEGLCEEIIAEHFPNLENEQISKSRKHTELSPKSRKAGQHQDVL